jgi:acetyl-CoA carboxylase biotin carboxyl carrier protein
MDWDDADVRAILQLVDAAGFDELEIETDRFSLSLRRGDAGADWTRESRTSGTPRELAAPAPDADTAPQDAVDPRLYAVKTPLPGTFYRSPKPGAPPFVEVGTPVVPETVVAIVETMKLMNSVYAGVSGRIANIDIADGAFAPQNAVLMRIEPADMTEGA